MVLDEPHHTPPNNEAIDSITPALEGHYMKDSGSKAMRKMPGKNLKLPFLQQRIAPGSI